MINPRLVVSIAEVQTRDLPFMSLYPLSLIQGPVL